MGKLNYYSRGIHNRKIDEKSLDLYEDNATLNALQRRFKNSSTIIDKAIPLWFFNNPSTSIPKADFPIPDATVKACTAIKLSMFLIEMINNNPYFFSKKNHLKEDFYIHCFDSLGKTNIINNINDTDLLIIYLKQLVIILKNSQLIRNSHGLAKVMEPIPSYSQLFFELFSTFWDKVRWENIFMSMPEFAVELKRNRNILIDLIMLQNKKFRIDVIANEFLQITELWEGNDLYLTSFLDFYFFTWLSHFGIVNYQNGHENEPVMIELTEFGRKFLNYFYDL